MADGYPVARAMRVCPNCAGYGGIVVGYAYRDDGLRDEERCPQCDGEGRVEIEDDDESEDAA